MSYILKARRLLNKYPELWDAPRQAQEIYYLKEYHRTWVAKTPIGDVICTPVVEYNDVRTESIRRSFQKINKRTENKNKKNELI